LQGKEVKHVLILLVSLVWYPHSLMRVQRLGYDFTIFYQGASHEGWFYAPWVSIFFEPLRLVSHDTAFTIHYVVSAFAFCILVSAASRRSEVWGVAVCLLGLYPYLLSQELGGLSVVLAALCLTFPGALLASLWKPYLLCFALYHALHKFRRDRKARTRDLDGADVQIESAVPHTTNREA